MRILLTLLSHENGNTLQNRHFPLSIGLISEYLKVNIKNINTILFKRPSLLSKEIELNKPDVVMFSNYMWNESLNCFYAKSIKEIYPDTLIIFGGPNISSNQDTNINFLKKNLFIDILVKGDGELISKLLIENFIKEKDIEKLKKYAYGNTLSILKDSKEIIYGNNEIDFRIGTTTDVSLDDIPSPYLSGAFDIFFEDAAIVLLETNRGCPYGCTYCQQGDEYFSKIRYYTHNRIKKELEYINNMISSKNLDMSIIEFADPNFGMYKNDTKIFEYLRESQDKYNYPSDVWCSTGKSNQKLILNNAKLLKSGSIMIRAAMQTLNNETLKVIKRKNLKLDTFNKLTISDKSMDIYSDIMLGLPKETKDSYLNGVYKLIDFGTAEFSMPQTILLKGTPMEDQEYINKYNINTKFRVIPECDSIYHINDITQRVTENEAIIISTNTLPFSDYLECRVFNLLVMIFHNTRLLNVIYEYIDSININRSIILKSILSNINKYPKVAQLINNYIKDTKDELSDNILIFDENDNIESRISNKIYKYLSIALFNYKQDIIKLIKDSLINIINNSILKELIQIIENQIINTFDIKYIQKKIIVTNKELQNLFGNSITLCYSDLQIKRLNSLKSIYIENDERINKLAYHLRPSNIIKKIRK